MKKCDQCFHGHHIDCTDCQCPCRGLIFNKEEILALKRLLSHHYISYEDMEAIKVTRRIMSCEDSDELRSNNKVS